MPPAAGAAEAFEITRSLPHGHVAAVLGTLRSLGLEEVIDPAWLARRDLVTAMIVAAVIDRSSKLATARGLRAETAASSLGAVLGLEACDEDELYEAMACCCPGSRRSRTPSRPGIWPAGRWCCMTCPRPRSAGLARWGRSGMPRGGVRGRLQIVYGVLTSAAGIPVAVQLPGPGGWRGRTAARPRRSGPSAARRRARLLAVEATERATCCGWAPR